MGSLVSGIDVTFYRENEIQIEKQINTLRKRNEELAELLSDAYCDIESSRKQIAIQDRELNSNKKELLETNYALKVLAKNLESIRKNTEEKLISNLYSNIYPIASSLKKASNKVTRNRQIDSLLSRLNVLCTTLRGENGGHFRKYLTTTEVKVATLIKDDLKSREIAKELKISVATVKTHRKNIRRKLKLHNCKINLANYLKMRWHKGL